MTPAHHRPSGGFRNPWLAGAPNRLGGFLKWVLVDRLTKRRPPDPDAAALRRAEPAFPRPRAAVGELVVTWVGHATFLVQVGGLNLLTDPIWSERASPLPFAGPRRRMPPGIDFDALPPIDAVLLSHNHYDHLDDRTTRRLIARHPDARWLTPLGLARFVRRRGAGNVGELDWWQETRVGAATIACTPAQHFSARGLRDRNATLWCGWAVAAGSRRVFFAGDTGYHPEFTAIGHRYGPFDAALVPIGAYEPRWFMRPVHMNPEEAVRALRDLDAARPTARRAVMVAMHWGTFKLTDEALDEPPVRVARAWREAGLRADDLWVLAPGETRRV